MKMNEHEPQDQGENMIACFVDDEPLTLTLTLTLALALDLGLELD